MTNGQSAHDAINKAIFVLICLSFFSLSVGTAPLSLCSLSALALWLISGRCYKDRADWLGQDWLLPVSALCVLPWVAIFWSSAPIGEAVKFAERSHYWLFAFLAASSMKSERTVRSVMICFVSGTAIMAIIRLFYSLGIIPASNYLNRAFLSSYITYSLLVVIAIALLAFFYREMTMASGRILILVLMIGFVLEITQLDGRSGYLALAVLSPWMCITMFGRRGLIPIFCGLLLLFTLMLTSQRVRDRIALIPKEIKLYQSGTRVSYQLPDGSLTPSAVGLRFMVWSNALKIFKKYPLFGAGTGAYQHEANKIDPENMSPHPHNSYLYIAANYGILGLGLYGWLLVVTLRRTWRSRNHLSGHSILAFLIVILIGSLTDTQVLSVATGIALGFIAGMPVPSISECVS